MGQSADSIANLRQETGLEAELSIFPTELGWFGIVGADKCLSRLTFAQGSAERVRETLGLDAPLPDWVAREKDWHPALRRLLTRYAAGEEADFSDIKLCLPRLTEFQQAIVVATRKIPYGATVSYGGLAAQAGYPRAARAVGSVMAANRFPILIPCHRVIASAGKLGGYSAPQGTDLKQILLTMEAETMATALR